jgi:poly(3-hydroxybutyrate) depolymerase
MRPTFIPLALATAVVCFLAVSGSAETLDSRSERLLARADLAAYRGWIKYLSHVAQATAARDGAGSETAQRASERLDNWTARISADPSVLQKLRGVQEWAYESPVDDSGQPFKLMIPTDYDPARPPGLTVVMHGYTGDHLKHSTGMADRTGDFEVAVLGRSRGGNYTGLSQADVLQVIDYIEAHWRIDPARIRVAGGSMGGAGTIKLGSRYPQRFAAAQITCGYLEQEPIANLLTLPLYATHSEDDMVVPVLHARGPLRELRRLGGQATFDLTNGLGHAGWNYTEGNARSAAWAVQQTRPDSRTVRRIDFTALDGAAQRAWWAEIAEWGPAAKPARFQLTAGANNTLFAELHNIARLRLRLDESPFDRAQPLRVVAGDAIAIEHPAPLPASLVLTATTNGWSFEATPPDASYRLHTPGGAVQLYDGAPLLIVHGTGGSEAARAALRRIALAASYSSSPAWVGDTGETDPADADRTPHHMLLFGALRVKADTEVTAADIARCHLVLLGTAEENSLVRRLAARLPARLEGARLVCSDGLELPATDRMLGLVHFNPEAPQRLLFWVASTSPDGYAVNATLPLLAAGVFTHPISDTNFFHAADLIVTSTTTRTLVATRSFDSHWRWIAGRESSPLLPAAAATREGLARAIAEAARRATGCDFAAAGQIPALGEAALSPGTTRVADVVSLFYGHPIDVVELSGDELIAAAARMAAAMTPATSAQDWCSLQPAVNASTIDPKGRYRIALPMLTIGAYARATQSAPRDQRRSEVALTDALERFLAAP